MSIAKTDSELRADLLRHGGMDDVHAVEAAISRDSLADRHEYRMALEALCCAYGIERRRSIGHGRTSQTGYVVG